ncbi:flagellar rod assembly protein/muramidase FlgJ [Vibrio sp. 10N.286.49.B3]|uniref:flagellar assembly peptidoglycan hydrolase FlgJ n=1 Tax=Vibrio sp. 10N.286.49.B3 TaxID=1880855 RepID=UPI000C84A20D|nr:flagellar assembly peptidoglycan hydrolase FlgJ [Vibrio sp. 10N.286.49.B3]PMH40989.1 flagellar rod assembly protein/muramidase FlgJ [Vibrio sp. 10N.286.49.B3]
MINNSTDLGFIHDISSLDKLRQQAVSGESEDEKQALTAAAKQFESIFTNMLFKSMRDANTAFKSDMFDSQNEQFYRQMLDEQMSSELSASGSLGLADMIVAQLTAGQGSDESEVTLRNEAFNTSLKVPVNEEKAREAQNRLLDSKAEHRKSLDVANTTLEGPAASKSHQAAVPVTFDSPQSFVQSMRPYANKAAQALGVDPSLLLAQAALETGWGSKIVKNSQQQTNNLFNIKADRSWRGDKVATQTLEFYDNTPVKETAAFRSYGSFQESFNDYVQFLNANPRYETALNDSAGSEQFIHAIHEAGYATDPNYADKILNIKKQIDNMN